MRVTGTRYGIDSFSSASDAGDLYYAAAGATIGIWRNGLRQIAIADTIRSAWPLTASSRNLSSVGSRHAGDPVYDCDQLGGPRQLLQPSARVGINQQIEVRAGQDLEKLSFCYLRFKEIAAPFDQMDSPSRHGVSF